MRWILLGNPENRRVSMFAEALRDEGHPPPDIVSWQTLLADPEALLRLPNTPAFLRIESAGENESVQRGLYLLGGGDPAVVGARAQLFAMATHHEGFLTALSWVDRALAERPAWVPLATTTAIARAFDKSAFHVDCAAAGVQVAPRIAVTDTDALFAHLDANPVPRVFVKQRYGSSAAGIGIYWHGARPRLLTTVQVTPRGWFNTRRLARVVRPEAIRHILDGLFADGAHVEEDVPKARLDGHFFDLRIVMVHRDPAFVVVRCSPHLLTNLHLGGFRGDLAAFQAACPPAVWDAVVADARTVMTRHKGLHLGLDVLIRHGFEGHAVIEGNAFGDLLPNLVGPDGRDVYRTEIARAAAWLDGTGSPH